MMMRWALACLICGLGFGGDAQAKKLKYEFEKGKDAKDFSTVRVKWTVKKRAFGPNAGPVGFSVALLKDKTFSDVALSTTIAVVNPNNEAGLALRIKRSGIAISGYSATTYIDSVNNLYNVKIVRYDNYSLDMVGGSQQALCYNSFIADPTNQFEFSAVGKKLVMYYDGKPVCKATDGKYKSGEAGFYSQTSPIAGYQPAASFRKVVIAD